MARVDSLVTGRLSNATVAWTLVAVLVASTVWSLLAGDPLWALFSAAVIAIAVVPAVTATDPSVTVSWPILLLSALPAIARPAGIFVKPLGYGSVAALGLLVVAEIDRFSAAEMPGWVAAVLVVMTTMSVASTWAVVRYLANVAVGTAFFTSTEALMWDLVVASTTGVVAGAVFERWLRGEEAV